MQGKKTAIVLFNLGGPDSLDAVRPFLFNLFNDPAIIGAPALIRLALAHFISIKRTPFAREIYKKMGGKSPILENTQIQAQALEKKLTVYGDVKVFICMRYWFPMSPEVVAQVKAYQPDQVILLPLYAQFSTSTTASSFLDWDSEAKKQGLHVPSYKIGCYPTQPKFIAAQVENIREFYAKIEDKNRVRILFSAHGLPEKIIEKGDPYQWQIEQTSKIIVDALAIEGLDWRVTYQSRVGPLKWIGPATDDEIKLAGSEGKSLIVVPIAFVSEHSETLVELDIEYGELAHHAGIKQYLRVPTVNAHPLFIEGLADLCLIRLAQKEKDCVVSQDGKRYCPTKFIQCPCA